jgi:hypothetical protein
MQAIEYNRDRGISGEVFFFYEGLRDNNNALAKVLQNNAYTENASFPSLSDLNNSSVANSKSSSISQKLLNFWKNIS